LAILSAVDSEHRGTFILFIGMRYTKQAMTLAQQIQDDDGVLAEIYLLWKKFSAKIVILSFIKGKNKNILLFICYHLKEYE